MSARDDLLALEHAMWSSETRGDRNWMDAHLTDDFVEYGRSGRTYDRQSILDTPVGPFRADLDDLRVERLAKNVALVTYRSTSIYGEAEHERANRSSIWVRHDEHGWRLRFHQGTPCQGTPGG